MEANIRGKSVHKRVERETTKGMKDKIIKLGEKKKIIFFHLENSFHFYCDAGLVYFFPFPYNMDVRSIFRLLLLYIPSRIRRMHGLAIRIVIRNAFISFFPCFKRIMEIREEMCEE